MEKITLAFVLIFVFAACDLLEQRSDEDPIEFLEADFTVSETEIEVGTTVYFSDLSENRPTSWLWEFDGGDPNYSTDRNPVVTYNTQGEYSVNLEVRNENGTDKMIKNDYITVIKTDPERSSFAGKWIVQNTNKKAKAEVGPKDESDYSNINFKGSNALPNLVPYTPENWSNAIIVKNYEVDNADFMSDDEINMGDDVYIAFSYVNESTVDITMPFTIRVSIDGEEVINKVQEDTVLGGYYWRHFNYMLSDYNLSPGSHLISLTIDSNNDILESNESDNTFSRYFSIGGSEATYSSFEFFESRYIVKMTDGTSLYGNLSANSNNSILTLENFGSINIISINTNSISFELNSLKATEGAVFNAYRETETGATNMTQMLTYDVWVLVSRNGGSGDLYTEWIFGKSGDYMFYVDGELVEKYWNYINESSFSYGFTPSATSGSVTINNISFSDLILTDATGTTFHFERN